VSGGDQGSAADLAGDPLGLAGNGRRKTKRSQAATSLSGVRAATSDNRSPAGTCRTASAAAKFHGDRAGAGFRVRVGDRRGRGCLLNHMVQVVGEPGAQRRDTHRGAVAPRSLTVELGLL
jgi:hypothetical protein